MTGEVISVAIHVDGRVIYVRTAVKSGRADGMGQVRYDVDTGETIWHDPENGVVMLATLLLDTIKEQK